MTRITPKSSCIKEFTYDEKSRELRVTNKLNQTYLHAGVPFKAFENMSRDVSAGRFYHSVIRRNYPGKAIASKDAK